LTDISFIRKNVGFSYVQRKEKVELKHNFQRFYFKNEII